MAFCGKCGTKIEEGVKFCSSCGSSVEASQETEQNHFSQQSPPPGGTNYNHHDSTNNFKKMFTNTADHTSEYAPLDIEKSKVVSIVAYFGFLFFIPLVAAPESKYGKFHANQGLLILITSVAFGLVNVILAALINAIFPSEVYYILGQAIGDVNGFGLFLKWIIGLICWAPTVTFFITGVINVSNGKAKDLPFIGKVKLIK